LKLARGATLQVLKWVHAGDLLVTVRNRFGHPLHVSLLRLHQTAQIPLRRLDYAVVARAEELAKLIAEFPIRHAQPFKRLVRARAFQDAKRHIGMAHYQARQWPSWHRHMALSMMAIQFMLQARLKHADAHPMLSCYGIQILLATTVPDRRSSQEEVLRQMQARHEKRQALIEAANRESKRNSLI
jgi:hypothetical protein